MPSCVRSGPRGLANAVELRLRPLAGRFRPQRDRRLSTRGLFTLAQLQALGGVATHVAPVVPGQVGLGWLKAFDMEFSWVGHFFHERLTVQPSVNVYNLFNFSNFDSAANTLTGQLNGNPGSINGTVQAGRPDRIGAGHRRVRVRRSSDDRVGVETSILARRWLVFFLSEPAPAISKTPMAPVSRSHWRFALGR